MKLPFPSFKSAYIALQLAATLAMAPVFSDAQAGEVRFRDGLELEDEDRATLQAFIGHAVDFADGLTAEKVAAKCLESPEMFAWIDFRQLNCLNIAYQLTGDTRYLDHLRDALEFYRAALSTGSDKYLSWYGSPIKPRIPADNPDIRIDELQCNFRSIAVIGLWIELAREDPSYARANGEAINTWLALLEEHLFPKWDERGFFVEIPGRGGVYRGLDFDNSAGQPTLSHEKLSIVVNGCLQLYHVTGKAKYMKRALQVGTWFKSCLSLRDGHYEWMSWCPAGRWDISTTKPDSWIPGWMAPDPNAAWYINAMSIALNLYQHGLLFDERDLERFVRTQKEMCWNGSFDDPEYRNAAGETGKFIKGRFLSFQLSNYDDTLTRLAFYGPHEEEVRKDRESSWKGGINAQDYVVAKYLHREVRKGEHRPFLEFGKQFLAEPCNREFHDGLNFPVNAPGAVIATRPSEMFPGEGS